MVRAACRLTPHNCFIRKRCLRTNRRNASPPPDAVILKRVPYGGFMMVRDPKKPLVQKSKAVSPINTDEVGEFLIEVDEARRYRDDLERYRSDLSPTEIVSRRHNLPLARKKVAELEKQLQELRGDFIPQSQAVAASSTPVAANPNGRMKIQAEAYELWLRLKASGANPTVNSISDSMARWCADNGVTTHTGVTPRAGTIRNTILGGSSGWRPPAHSRDQAKSHVAQLAQAAQPNSSSAV